MSAAPSARHPLQPIAGLKHEVDLGAASESEQHKRVYQACIPCRRRKVKCDLGSVDNPSDPPCVRCRRESKECFFSATRRKRKTDDGTLDSLDGYELGDDYRRRNGRKMAYGTHSPQESRQPTISAPISARPATFPDARPDILGLPLTPGGSIGRTQPLRRPPHAVKEESADEALENFEAKEVMRREVYGPHDALDLLYKAATDDPMNREGDLSGRLQLPPILGLHRAGNHQPLLPKRANQKSFVSDARLASQIRGDAAIDPALSADNIDQEAREKETGYEDALKAWARFRFVRAGWFTPQEAIAYIDYYYAYLSPLTPISPPTFRDLASHITLLYEEPILTITLLTIASRYRKLSGTGGHCRSYAIHEQLWTYLRGMIERCLWGQEIFGGGLYGGGGQGAEGPENQTSTTAPERGMRKGSLRTLGTVESLMILTEWHPRALHFPPAEATDELMLPSYERHNSYSTNDESGHRPAGGIGGRRIESWLEPAWRSDRMSWMLLSNAMGLSYELGVFDEIEDPALDDMTRPEYRDEEYRLRAARIKRLLLIYVTQLAGRLGWTSMVPESLSHSSSFIPPRKGKLSTDGRTPETATTASGPFTYIPNLEIDDTIIHCWAGISNAMRIGNEKLFKSRKYTTSIIQDGTYTEHLRDFQPMLRNWKKEFDRFDMPPYIRQILSIEYEYVRIYINSLSLQSVVERCTTKTSSHTNNPRPPDPGAVNETIMTSRETQHYYSKMPLTKLGGFSVADQTYVKEVIEGSRNLLRIVVEGLLPNGYLKHAPVRTYFQIVSGAMFLLKTFALGATRYDVEISIGLIDAVVEALRTCVVDDVHLGTRFADLLMSLTSRLRSRFISVPTDSLPRDVKSSLSLNAPDAKRQRLDSRNFINEWNAQTPNYADANGSDNNLPNTPYSQPIFYPNTAYTITPGGTSYPAEQAYSAGREWNNTNEMWYLPPGAAFFQDVNDQAITQTAEGVQVGGIDLLDYMALDSFSGLENETF